MSFNMTIILDYVFSFPTGCCVALWLSVICLSDSTAVQNINLQELTMLRLSTMPSQFFFAINFPHGQPMSRGNLSLVQTHLPEALVIETKFSKHITGMLRVSCSLMSLCSLFSGMKETSPSL